MKLLFPGRHLVQTKFQEIYLGTLLKAHPITELVFIVTSANQSNCRFNPVHITHRCIALDRFAQQFNLPYHLVEVPHMPQNPDFVEKLCKTVSVALNEPITPESSEVLISTPQLIEAWSKNGFKCHVAEDTLPVNERYYPATVIELLGTNKPYKHLLADSSLNFFNTYPSVIKQIHGIWNEQLLTQTGGFTENRNYTIYLEQMESAVAYKLEEFKQYIKPGKIVDDGCAAGGLLQAVAKIYPDSDVYGIDLSNEFMARFKERQRRGAFGKTFAHFIQGNLLKPLFPSNSVDTVLSTSVTHELFSYADGVNSLKTYFQLKFEMLAPGGCFILRDVIGPDEPEKRVVLTVPTTDGSNNQSDPVTKLSTHGKLIRFIEDYKITGSEILGDQVRLKLKDAAEFLLKKNYTESWEQERKEEFTFARFLDYKTWLTEAGFLVHPNSTTVINPWTLANSWNDCSLTDENNNPVAFPPTHMVLIAQKPH